MNLRAPKKRTISALAGLLAFTAVFLTSNCGSARPVSYYTLNSTPTPGPSVAVKTDAPLPLSIAVGRIAASHLYLNDPIVYGNGGVELGTYEYHRWVDVPTEMLETMLVQALRAQGKFRSVGRLGSGAKADYILRGHLYSLEEIDSPSITARFSIELELFQPKTGMVVWNQSYSQDEHVGEKSVTAVVEALRKEVLTGFNQLTTSLDAYLASHSAQ